MPRYEGVSRGINRPHAEGGGATASTRSLPLLPRVAPCPPRGVKQMSPRGTRPPARTLGEQRRAHGDEHDEQRVGEHGAHLALPSLRSHPLGGRPGRRREEDDRTRRDPRAHGAVTGRGRASASGARRRKRASAGGVAARASQAGPEAWRAAGSRERWRLAAETRRGASPVR